MTGRKEYVITRYDGGSPKIVIHITDDDDYLFVMMYHLKRGESLQSIGWHSYLHFSAATALLKGKYGFWNQLKSFFGQIPAEEKILMRLKHEVHKATYEKIDRRSMLKLIRGVDNLISTFNGRAK